MESVYLRYRRAFAAALAQALGRTEGEVLPLIKDAEPAHGDLSFAAFAEAKAQKKAPPVIAKELAEKLRVPGLTVAAAGPYVNARLTALPFAAEVIAEVRAAGKAYGGSQDGAKKAIVIDYSSPNIAKPIAFHHIRSTVIGGALARLYRSQGYRVEGINYLGDWGKQFGLVAVGFEDYGDPSRRGEMAHLVDVYIKANQKAEADPAYDERARAFFRRMEQDDPAAKALWQELRQVSLTEFQKVYGRLGVSFEHYEGESRYQGKMEPIVQEIGRTVGVKESEGALIVDLPYAEGEPPVLLKKTDGSTLYVTRDLAAAQDRWDRFQPERLLYVVATDQALHFKQLFTVLKAMQRPWAERMQHVNFGRVHGMSTRKGNLVLLTDVLDEAKNRALEKVRENQKVGRIETEDAEQLAEQIGLGAVVFGDLKNRRVSDYTFDWEELLSFEGHTGPYVQYAHARACNVLRKAAATFGALPQSFDAARLELPEEQAVLRAVARFPEQVAAAADNEPSYVARHLLELSTLFSRWYTAGNQDRQKRVLVEDDAGARAARLMLTDAVRLTLASGLTLLGVPTPEAM